MERLEAEKKKAIKKKKKELEKKEAEINAQKEVECHILIISDAHPDRH